MGNREQRAAQAEARAERAREREAAADAAVESGPWRHIPLGQPILVGHHSQRRHERDLARMESAYRASAEATRARQEAEAAAAVPAAARAINVTDDDAVAALRAKVAGCERTHALMVEHNRTHRSAPVATWRQRPADGFRYPGYALSNARNRTKAAREQLAKAEAHAAHVAEVGDEPQSIASGNGWALTDEPGDGRVRFTFDGKPDERTRALLKGHGFRWAPSAGAWQRQDTANGIAAAKMLATRLSNDGRGD